MLPARKHGTRRIRQQHHELCHDGHRDRRRLTEMLSECKQRFSLLEHHLMPNLEVLRCRSLVLRERHKRREPRRNFLSLRQRAQPRRAHHQRAGAPRVDTLRKRGVELRMSQAGAHPGQPPTERPVRK